MLAELVNILPNTEESPVKPFLSLVVNINFVCTVAHRDAKDFRPYLILPIGNFIGGRLVMREQGVVIEMHNGDFACFRSAEMTHVNLDYLGERASSVVLHSDGEFQKWKDNHNGWSNHGYFNST